MINIWACAGGKERQVSCCKPWVDEPMNRDKTKLGKMKLNESVWTKPKGRNQQDKLKEVPVPKEST